MEESFWRLFKSDQIAAVHIWRVALNSALQLICSWCKSICHKFARRGLGARNEYDVAGEIHEDNADGRFSKSLEIQFPLIVSDKMLESCRQKKEYKGRGMRLKLVLKPKHGEFSDQIMPGFQQKPRRLTFNHRFRFFIEIQVEGS